MAPTLTPASGRRGNGTRPVRHETRACAAGKGHPALPARQALEARAQPLNPIPPQPYDRTDACCARIPHIGHNTPMVTENRTAPEPRVPMALTFAHGVRRTVVGSQKRWSNRHGNSTSRLHRTLASNQSPSAVLRQVGLDSFSPDTFNFEGCRGRRNVTMPPATTSIGLHAPIETVSGNPGMTQGLRGFPSCVRSGTWRQPDNAAPEAPFQRCTARI